MAYRLRIGGTDKTSQLRVNTLKLAARLNSRNRASFQLTDTTGTYRPSIGAEVILDSGENLLLYSGDPNDSAWTKDAVTIGTGLKDPLWGVAAYSISDTASNVQHAYYQVFTSTVATYTLSAYLRDGGRRYASLWAQGGGTAYALYDLEAGTITASGQAQYISSAIQNLGGGWYRCSLTFAAASASTSYAVLYLSNSSGNPWPSYIGSGLGVQVYGMQLQHGSEVGPYADTTSAAITGTPRYFGGFIDSFTETLTIDGNTTALTYEVEAVSYDALADRRLVAASYESGSQTLSTIVSDVVTTFLAGDGLTTTNVATGPVIDKIKFNYVPASAVFDELANITGYAWWVDESKNLYFQPRSAIAAPFEISASNARRVMVQRTTETYRNKQLIRAGVDLTASRTENFSGDGTQKAWTLAYPAGVAPTSLTVGGVAKTVGIRGVDTGKDWYYQIGDAVINQDDGAAAVGAGVAIAVTYQGQYPILVNAQNDAQIASQAALASTSGVYETIDERANLNNQDAAGAVAEGLLRRYGAIPRRLIFETDTSGLAPGQLLTATFTPHAVSGSWLVDSVSASDRNGRELVYSIEALSGESLGGWQAFFEALSEARAGVTFRENEVIIYLRIISETVSLTDSLSAVAAAPESRVGFALVGQSEVGA